MRALLVLGMVMCCAGSFVIGDDPDVLAADRAGNNDGYLQLSEIAEEDLAGVTAYASLAGLDIQKPMPVSSLLEGSSRYRQLLLGDRLDNAPIAGMEPQVFGKSMESRVKSFDNRLAVEAAVTREDILRAYSVMQRCDTNRDTMLSFPEVRNSRYAKYFKTWFLLDHDRDGMLSIDELSTYYVQYRDKAKYDEIREQSTWIIEGTEITAGQRASTDRFFHRMDRDNSGYLEGSEIPASWEAGWVQRIDLDADRRLSQREMYLSRTMYESQSRQSRAIRQHRTEREEQVRDWANDLARELIARHSSGGNETRGMLRRDAGDLAAFGDEIQAADSDNNGYLVRSELRDWLIARIESQPTTGLPPELPTWFVSSDLDGDQQVSLAEFLQNNDPDLMEEFVQFDANHDGIVAPAEINIRPAADKLRFEGQSPLMIPGDTTEIAELFISESITIADIDIQLAIAKEREDNIDLELVGPDGSLASLLTDSRRMPWRNGRVFINAIIDDEAPTTRDRMTRPPLHRSFRPQSVGSKNEKSLRVFYGKPATGRWAFIIKNNTSKACLLEGWALLIKPADAEPEPDELLTDN